MATLACTACVQPTNDVDPDSESAEPTDEPGDETTSIRPTDPLVCPIRTHDSTDTGILSEDQRVEAGTCTPPTTACVPIAAPILLTLDDGAAFQPSEGPQAHVITTRSALESFWSTWGVNTPVPAVDFNTDHVLVAGYLMNSTCDASRVRSVVEQCGDTVRLTVESIDQSGTCAAVCDAPGGVLTVVTVPASLHAESCSTTCLTCAF